MESHGANWSADARLAQDKIYEWEMEAPRAAGGNSGQQSQVPAEVEKAVNQSRSAFGAMMDAVKK